MTMMENLRARVRQIPKGEMLAALNDALKLKAINRSEYQQLLSETFRHSGELKLAVDALAEVLQGASCPLGVRRTYAVLCFELGDWPAAASASDAYLLAAECEEHPPARTDAAMMKCIVASLSGDSALATSRNSIPDGYQTQIGKLGWWIVDGQELRRM